MRREGKEEEETDTGINRIVLVKGDRVPKEEGKILSVTEIQILGNW